MRILVVGGGGREHALVWRLGRNTTHEIYAMPGNPGIARSAQCLPGLDMSPKAILAVAEALNAELTVIGPEGPLVAGVVDHFRAARRPIIGPNAQAAQLEGSKIYSKNFFQEIGIPTARFAVADDPQTALTLLDRFTFPVVVKADGLAAGKGVTIAQDRAQAEAAVHALGPRLVIEEFLQGPELSFIVLTDGRTIIPLLPSRDHKRVFDHDQGPNTGGMGAYCDPALLSDTQTAAILDTIIRPTVEATGYTGFLYAGLILTADGPKILEFNVRLGDPEAQAILAQVRGDFAGVLAAAADTCLGTSTLEWKLGASVCVVLAAVGYPGSVRTGDKITGIPEAESNGATVFHAGTKVGWGGIVTAGGRVLGVTASADNLSQAAERAYAGVSKIHFEGMQYRRDIGRPYDKATGT